eukprot:scaffold320570_cov28-Tisochrysis_lutea.AAC.1
MATMKHRLPCKSASGRAAGRPFWDHRLSVPAQESLRRAMSWCAVGAAQPACGEPPQPPQRVRGCQRFRLRCEAARPSARQRPAPGKREAHRLACSLPLELILQHIERRLQLLEFCTLGIGGRGGLGFFVYGCGVHLEGDLEQCARARACRGLDSDRLLVDFGGEPFDREEVGSRREAREREGAADLGAVGEDGDRAHARTLER